jgi:hypothetical protein
MPGFTQRVDGSQMYVTHYAFFAEPDPGIPQGLWLVPTGDPNEPFVPDTTVDLLPPIAERTFKRTAPGPWLTQTGEVTNLMPYSISPVPLASAPQPPPPGVLYALSAITGIQDPTAIAAGTQTVIIAYGSFLPTTDPTLARFDGIHLAIEKTIRWGVQVRFGYFFAPAGVGIIADYVTNAQAAGVLQAAGVNVQLDPSVDPNGRLTYEWHARVTLSTENSFYRSVASEPLTFADPLEGDIALQGSPVDAAGHYTIVGSVAKPSYLESPTASVPEIFLLIFGQPTLSDCEFAYAETGTVTWANRLVH